MEEYKSLAMQKKYWGAGKIPLYRTPWPIIYLLSRGQLGFVAFTPFD